MSFGASPLISPGAFLDQAKQAAQLGNNSKALKNQARIEAVSRDFESVFLTQMMENMFDEAKEGSWFGEGMSGDVYRSLMATEYSKLMAQAGGIGIADYVKGQLIKLQEV